MVFHITAQLLALLCILAGVPACSSTGAHYETSRTNADGVTESRRVGYNNVRIRDDAPEVARDLLNIASPFLPPGVNAGIQWALAGFAGWMGKGALARRREDRLYDEAYLKGQAASGRSV